MNTSAFQVVVSAVNMLRILMNVPSWAALQSSAAHANFNCADLCHKWGQQVDWTYLSAALLCKHAKSNLAVMLLIFSDQRWSTPRLEASSENLLLSLRCICWGLLSDKRYSSIAVLLCEELPYSSRAAVTPGLTSWRLWGCVSLQGTAAMSRMLAVAACSDTPSMSCMLRFHRTAWFPTSQSRI